MPAGTELNIAFMITWNQFLSPEAGCEKNLFLYLFPNPPLPRKKRTRPWENFASPDNFVRYHLNLQLEVRKGHTLFMPLAITVKFKYVVSRPFSAL